MAVQNSYNYNTPKGVAGGLYDLSPHSVDSRINGETEPDKLKFGMGAVQGANPGTDVKAPTDTDTADKFEGLLLNGFTNEMDYHGDVKIYPLQTVGVLQYGKGWARVVPELTIAYGDPLYLVKSGDNAGLFTNEADGNIAVNGAFGKESGTGNVHLVVIYNQSATADTEANAEAISSLDARVTALENA
jgi:hypothetical protein